MKKFFIVLLICIYLVGVVACSSQDVSQDAMVTNEEVEENTLQNEEKDWSEQDIINMFYSMTNGEIGIEYLDCILMPDHVNGHIGAVLFENTNDGTIHIAFFDEEGYAQQCGVYAKVADAPDLIYLNGGIVTFKLETDEDIIYNCTISISIDDNMVAFVIVDDLQK